MTWAVVVLALLGADGARRVESNGVALHVRVVGDGEPLLLLHGGAGSSDVWAPYVRELSRHFQLVMPDARGHGRSGVGDEPFSYRRMADDFAALLETLGVSSANVVGWSDGGIAGLHLAVHHPKKVKRLVVIGANFRFDGLRPDAQRLFKKKVPTFAPATRKAWEAQSPEPGRWPEVAARLWELWRTEPGLSAEELRGVRARALVVVGEKDLVKEAHARELAGLIPMARLWVIPGAAHEVVKTDPTRVLKDVVPFLLEK